MTIGQAIGAIPETVEKLESQDIRSQISARTPRASVALRNAALQTLRGKSPSLPGQTPGVVTGHLRRAWTPFAYEESFGIESGAGYSGYLEYGTRKMAARPYVEKVKKNALPKIISIFSEIGR